MPATLSPDLLEDAPATLPPDSLEEMPAALTTDQLERMNAYWRAANYLSVGQIYLKDNPLLEAPLRLEHGNSRLHSRRRAFQPWCINVWPAHLIRSWRRYTESRRLRALLQIPVCEHGNDCLLRHVHLLNRIVTRAAQP